MTCKRGWMKRLVIDGHNLIPKIPGFRLEDPDDEMKLIEKMTEYCRLTRSQAELFFDGAPAGSPFQSKSGLVHIHYVRKSLTADDAILQFLQRQGNEARTMLVVSSDHRVITGAKALHAGTIPSEEFSRRLIETLSNPGVSDSQREHPPSEEEVEEMLKLMTGKRKDTP